MATKTQMHDVDFGQRSRLALTHPVTLAALGVLLLNDLVFKSLWSNPWTTGKLSDLAWVVFASPLLAFLLSLLVRDNRRGQRTAFIVAYVGLPLLYAAYNTFAPVHDAIIGGLLLVSGGTIGSPLDPTDSLVIPVGLAVALWVWRRSSVKNNAGRTGILRQRIVLVAAALATIASIATSPESVSRGITDLFITEENVVFALTGYAAYESTDGGVTWQATSDSDHEYLGEHYTSSKRPKQRTVVTPRGTFSVSPYESGVTYTSTNGDVSIVYETDYLKGPGAEWIQEQDTSRHPDPRIITTRPYSIVYDTQSFNVIVAMGLQGALVGTPDGKWTPVAVGPYHPTDFSFTGKIETLLESPVWSVVLSLPLAVVMVVIAVSAFLARIDPDQLPIGTLIYLRRASIPVAMALSATALVAAVLQVLIFYAPYNPHDLGFFDDSVVYLLMVIASIAAFLAEYGGQFSMSVARYAEAIGTRRTSGNCSNDGRDTVGVYNLGTDQCLPMVCYSRYSHPGHGHGRRAAAVPHVAAAFGI